MTGGTGFASVQVRLNVGFAEGQSRRAAINYGTQRGAMAFPKGRDTKHSPPCITGHTHSPHKG
ncbi:hypothetical protein CARN8_2870006 [mine drainage metagenome]|uniref:Uncharacterized protein n=1 Tax=mine drainage metagenome TaxID=410659 RepID=A0A3P3ZNF9_9ZZZZ